MVKAPDEPKGEGLGENLGIKARILPGEEKLPLLPPDRGEGQQGAEALAEGRGQGCPGDAKGKHGHQQIVQEGVGQKAGDQDAQAFPGFAHGPEDGAVEVIQEGGGQGRPHQGEVQPGVLPEFPRGVKKQKEGPLGEEDGQGEGSGEKKARQEGVQVLGTEGRQVPRPPVSRKEDAKPLAEADDGKEQQV